MTSDERVYYPTKITNQQSLSTSRSVKASQHIDAIRDKYITQIPTWMQKLFPNAIQRLINQRELEIINVELKHERDLAEYLHKIEFEAMQEQLQAQLSRHREKTRRELSVDISKNSEQLESELLKLLKSFLKEANEIMKDVNENEDPETYNIMKEEKNEMIARFRQNRRTLIASYQGVFREIAMQLD